MPIAAHQDAKRPHQSVTLRILGDVAGGSGARHPRLLPLIGVGGEHENPGAWTRRGQQPCRFRHQHVGQSCIEQDQLGLQVTRPADRARGVPLHPYDRKLGTRTDERLQARNHHWMVIDE